ncbi:hypothetical protein L1987_55640 [Smallanthus sonchifolius]|uniref:Uncharacterized protein n=1 Tax=Smallanthus sonchifolius TaxID=185202 RepID=A0ACB9EBK3_9ASTR|nr:hypothetical protein L1987_55640 [Smallanthus sonchifolius]
MMVSVVLGMVVVKTTIDEKDDDGVRFFAEKDDEGVGFASVRFDFSSSFSPPDEGKISSLHVMELLLI